jgi:transcriptional regulator with GAF, ATPase, and Fis domain
VALFGERLRETLQDISALLTSALDHDLAQIWLFDPDGALELSAARPLGSAPFEQMHPSDHGALAEALHQRRLVRIGHGALRPWVPAETRELIVVPLTDGPRSLGVLLLGREKERYEDADEELAGVLGRFVSRIVSKRGQAWTEAVRRAPSAPQAVTDREWEEEAQLAGG